MIRLLALASVCGLLLACESGAAAGTTCSTTSECASPLVCRLGRCRNECAASRDCPAGARCLLDPAGLGACSVVSDDRCESGGASCPAGLTCLGGRCVNTCSSADDCPTDGECREVVAAGVSFCFAPTREDGGPGLDASTEDGGASDGGGANDGGASDAGASDGGAACTTASCAIDLCMGDEFACAVRGDHTVVCWGSNQAGQLGDGASATTADVHPSYDCGAVDCSALPVQVLRADGTGALLADSIACASATACAREATSGRIFCWGNGGSGELPMVSSTSVARATELPGIPSRAQSLVGGHAFFCATFAPPTDAVCWGNDEGQFGLPTRATTNPADVPHWTGQSLVAGGIATCGLSTSGVVRCAGINTYGEIGPNVVDPLDGGVQFGPVVVPLGPGTVTSLVAGDEFACALVDGVANCWGFDETGSLGRTVSHTCGPVMYACDAHPAPVDGTALFDTLWIQGDASRICGRSGDTTMCWGGFSAVACELSSCRAPLVIPGLAHATLVASSTRSVCGIVADGAVVCSGNDAYGQLGRGSVGATSGLETDYVPVCLAGGC